MKTLKDCLSSIQNVFVLIPRIHYVLKHYKFRQTKRYSLLLRSQIQPSKALKN